MWQLEIQSFKACGKKHVTGGEYKTSLSNSASKKWFLRWFYPTGASPLWTPESWTPRDSPSPYPGPRYPPAHPQSLLEVSSLSANQDQERWHLGRQPIGMRHWAREEEEPRSSTAVKKNSWRLQADNSTGDSAAQLELGPKLRREKARGWERKLFGGQNDTVPRLQCN